MSRKVSICDMCNAFPPLPGKIDCARCDAGVGVVDEAVNLIPTRKAQCGHISFNHRLCQLCLQGAPETDLTNMYQFTKAVQEFDLRRLGAQTKSGLWGDSFSNPKQFEDPFKEWGIENKGVARNRKRNPDGAKYSNQVGNKHYAHLKTNGVSKYLGSFDSEEEARDEVLTESLIAESYNFPDQVI